MTDAVAMYCGFGVGDIDARACAMLQLAGSPTANKVRGGEGKRRGE
jgi:hypothetical protein